MLFVAGKHLPDGHIIIIDGFQIQVNGRLEKEK
jgi:hypothetical protein